MKHAILMLPYLMSLLIPMVGPAQTYEAMNFTVTDLQGQTHTFYDYLDEGKSVLLEFLAP